VLWLAALGLDDHHHVQIPAFSWGPCQTLPEVKFSKQAMQFIIELWLLGALMFAHVSRVVHAFITVGPTDVKGKSAFWDN
jgi:hypothetical protein